MISTVGPGTGLGVEQLLRRKGRNFVSGTEGGHMDFAPLDELEASMLGLLRSRYRRVSVERIVSGPGLANIHETLARIEGLPIRMHEDASRWKEAPAGSDSLSVAHLGRFCLRFGSVAGARRH